jgi:transposase InsO family protein
VPERDGRAHSRRGYVGQLVSRVAALGVQAITGKPYKPTTQGKNERFHQTLFRHLDKQPIAESLAELQARYGEKDMEEIFVKAVGGEAALIAAMKN